MELEEQTEQYSTVQWGGAVLQHSGVGLSAAVAGWGCFAVVRDLVNSLCPLIKPFVGTVIRCRYWQ